jgi:hypothetical protein
MPYCTAQHVQHRTPPAVQTRVPTLSDVPNNAKMKMFRVDEFARMLKYGTLLHHHGPIDRIVSEYVHTRDFRKFTCDLIALTGSRDVVLESAYLAWLSLENPSVSDPYSNTMHPSRACSVNPSPLDPGPHPYHTRTRSQGCHGDDMC